MNLRAKVLRNYFWINDWFHNSPIGKPYKEILDFSKLGFAESCVMRNKALNNLLDHFRQNTVFYSKYLSDDLSDYPVMNKSLIIENYKELKVDEDSIPFQKGPLHIQKTSGSTGIPFAIPQDTCKRNRRIAELKYYGKIVGFNSHDRLIHLRAWNKWQSKSKLQSFKENILPFDITNLNDDKLESLCNLINSSKAKCIRGYASTIDLLSRYIQQHPHSFSHLKVIIAGGETLQEETRWRVKQYMKCNIISQYANEECGILAQEHISNERDNNKMYLNNSGYIFEFLKLDSDEKAGYGELSRIVITDLFNYAFPIIRYDTGDTAIVCPPDQYSGGYPVIEKLYGRRFDLCFSTSGEILHPIAIGRVMKNMKHILQWQFIQEGEKEYLLKIVKDTDNFDIERILAELKDIVGEDAIINYEFIIGDLILASGKRRPVVNNWKHV